MTTTRRLRTRRAAAALAVTFVLAGTAACGDDDGDEGTATTTTEPSSATGTPETDSAKIAITAVDYAFKDLPDEMQGGAALTLRNQSAKELHELVAMRLPDGELRSAKELVQLPEQDLGALFGGPPALVLIAPPGDEGFAALGDGTLDEPGRYIFMCFIPTGAEPSAYLDALKANPGQPPSVPGGPPHFTAGMYVEVTVR